jgi:hypothetical protein
MARLVELWDGIIVIPPALAACPVVLAFGYELWDLKLRRSRLPWLSPGV